jgi:HAD superfamily hydrolase (TIGR01450 family)
VIERTPGAVARLAAVRAWALDMDGTTYLGERVLPGVPRFLDTLAARGAPYVFLTNNSSKSRREYEAKLARLGLRVPDGAVMTSGEATIRHLLRERPGQRVFLVATESFRAEVEEAGIPLVAADEADVAVLAFDTGLTFRRLADLCDVVRRGRPFVATHPDVNCPVDGGYLPDVGALLKCVEASTGRVPDLVVGKPGDRMVAALCERLGQPADRVAYVGDRLYTDVAMARRAGMLAVLVLTGETALADLDGAAVQPDVVATDLGEVADALAALPPA